MSSYRPTGNTLSDGQIEVTAPSSIYGALSQPFGVSPEQFRAVMDPQYRAENPGLDPRRPYPTNQFSYMAGQGLANAWKGLQSNNLSSDAVGAVGGAGLATGLSYLVDAVRHRLLGGQPMSGGSRALIALLGAAGGGVANHMMRAGMKVGSAQWGEEGFMQDRMRHELARKVEDTYLPYDLKSKVLRMIDDLGGSDLLELARIVGPMAGGMAGVAIAKYFFGNSIIPAMLGGALGFAAGRSAFEPRVNAMGLPML